jgi:iron-sulfur cluster repair protein YtfE (RIC family)
VSEDVARLAAALERHFETEESIYFPLAERASAQSARLLERARWGHQRLREALADLRALVEGVEIEAARRSFAALLRGLQIHEEEEVAILVALERHPDSGERLS